MRPVIAHAAPLVALVTMLAVYAIGVARLWRRGGRGRGGITITGAVAFGAGWWTTVVALAPPLDTLVERTFWIHMSQHVALVTVAAPLLALGRPALGLAWALPPSARRAVVRLARRVLGATFAAWALHALALWIWHAPPLYDAAATSDAWHALEHVTLAGTAVVFWAALVDAAARRRRAAAAAYVFATALHCTLLGALLTVAPAPWYAHYARTSAAFGLSALEDQQLAGLVMWVPAGAILTVAGLALVASTLREAQRRVAHTRVERLRRSAALVVLVAVTLALSACEGARATAARMTGGDVDHGREALRAYGCWTCHTIPGVAGASGAVGPPLTGLGVRAFVAGQPNSPAHLIAWIRHPHAVRPSTPMPELGVTERDGRDIAAYLYTLR